MKETKSRRFIILGFSLWLLFSLLSLKGVYLPGSSAFEPDLVIQLRLPRLLLATSVGAALAVSGTVLQVMFQNPLCEPYTLGVASGAALGAVIASLFNFGILFFGAFLAPAFFGAALFNAILLSFNFKKGVSQERLLLFGVMLSFLGSSLLSLILVMSEGGQAQSLLMWLLGDLSRAELGSSIAVSGLIAGIILILWTEWRTLDGLLFGEESARSLGIDVRKATFKLMFLVSVLVGLSVSSAGMIGFVGLVVPHFLRKNLGSLHLRLIPLSALYGAVLLVGADLLSRWVASPLELPVGAMTAMIGAPLFAVRVLWEDR